MYIYIYTFVTYYYSPCCKKKCMHITECNTKIRHSKKCSTSFILNFRFFSFKDILFIEISQCKKWFNKLVATLQMHINESFSAIFKKKETGVDFFYNTSAFKKPFEKICVNKFNSIHLNMKNCFQIYYEIIENANNV